MSRGTRRAWQAFLVATAVLVAADLASRLAYSETAVAAQVELAVRRADAIQPGVAKPEPVSRPPRLRVTVLP
ncbi:hypothetical protein H0176_27490 [Methylorubrum populi]|uniref:Uncharacterized protein n=1 Tax=Methylorubrum rhodesianum TaxID=29427 RepID=A0ABU9Z5Z5_9HYPH|nr:hypothetical protein [Methylorubrum rhodesianum]MBK3402488.1 hypothetical protein [Methylorubrum rhodesianum]MBY0143965.1 hypothetical protein [Methylorubrum populi]